MTSKNSKNSKNAGTVRLSPEAQKLADAADTLECVREQLAELMDFWDQAYLICNNSFVRGMAELMGKKISDAISIIRENKAWQEHRDYLVKLNN